MTESTQSHDDEQFLHLKGEVIRRVLADTDKINFFGLSEEKVATWAHGVLFDGHEFRPSPGYMSAGWGHNQTDHPMVGVSSFGPAVENMVHEIGHGEHNLLCQTLYEGKDSTKNLDLFKKNVLGDIGFIEQIDKPGGSPLQERMLKAVRDLCGKDDVTGKEVGEIAWMLGALTYQHAYYVDPGMCEAAASYHDTGVTLFVDEYNQWFAKLLIPGEQFFEGYANHAWQEMFRKTDRAHKALLIKRADYKREVYFA